MILGEEGDPQEIVQEIENERKWEKKSVIIWTLPKEIRKSCWTLKMKVIPIVIGLLVMVSKGKGKILKELKIWRKIETIQTTAVLRSARILRRILETWGNLLSTDSGVKNSQGL